MSLKENSEENLINCHISNHDFSQHLKGQSSPNLDIITNLQNSYKYNTIVELHSTLFSAFLVYSMTECAGKVIEISYGKILNIIFSLNPEHEEQLIQGLKYFSDTFAWEYTEMRGIHLDTCIHHIYIEGNAKPVRQLQRRMNLSLK